MTNYISEEAFIDNFVLLIKFGEKENLENFQEGKLYMKNLKYYNQLEETQKIRGIGDKNDGKMIWYSFTRDSS